MAKSKVTDRASAVNLVVTDGHHVRTPEDITVQGLLTLQSLSHMAYCGIINQPVWADVMPIIVGFDVGYWLKVNELVTACIQASPQLTAVPQADAALLQDHLACLSSLLDQALGVLLPLLENNTAQHWYNLVYTLWLTTQSVAQASSSLKRA